MRPSCGTDCMQLVVKPFTLCDTSDKSCRKELHDTVQLHTVVWMELKTHMVKLVHLSNYAMIWFRKTNLGCFVASTV